METQTYEFNLFLELYKVQLKDRDLLTQASLNELLKEKIVKY